MKASGGPLGGHEHDARGEVRPAVLDASIKVFATHSGHPKITQDNVIAASGEPFECGPSVLRSLYMVAMQT